MDDDQALEQARAMNEAFASRLPGMLGIVCDHVAPDRVVAHVDVTEQLIAGTGFMFAPVVIALADGCSAFGCGGNIPEGASFTTVELKTNFMSSARVGERVVCTATPAHLGRQTQVWDAVVENETTGRRMALFRCTQMILAARS